MNRVVVVLLLLVAVGCASGPQQTLRFHEQVPDNMPETRLRFVTLERSGQRLAISPYPTVGEKDVVEARVQPGPGGNAILLRFDLHGANLLHEMSGRLRGRYLVVLVDERPVAAVLVERIIRDGQFLLFGDLTDEQTVELAASLNKTAGRRRDLGAPVLLP